jgi:hypothetical protein
MVAEGDERKEEEEIVATPLSWFAVWVLMWIARAE